MTQWKVTFVNDKNTIQKAEEKLVDAEIVELRGKTATYYAGTMTRSALITTLYALRG